MPLPPLLFSEYHTLSFTVMIYILPSLTFPLSFTSLTFSLIFPPFLLLILPLLLLNSKTYSVYFACACYKMFPGHFQSL